MGFVVGYPLCFETRQNGFAFQEAIYLFTRPGTMD